MCFAKHVRLRLAEERASPGQHLVEDDAEGEDVGARVDEIADRLFRRHVARGADGRAGAGQRHAGGGALGRRVVRLADLGDPEIQHLHQVVVGDHDVARLQIAMHDAGTMRAPHGLRNLGGVAHDLVDAEGALLEEAAQGAAPHQLHGDEVDALVGVDLVDRDDARMIEGGGGLGLAEESFLASNRIAVAGWQHLQGDVAVQGLVVRQPHLSHPAVAKVARDDVLPESSP